MRFDIAEIDPANVYKLLTATVATRPRLRRRAGKDPAMSTIAITQPPNTSPAGGRAEGIGITRNSG